MTARLLAIAMSLVACGPSADRPAPAAPAVEVAPTGPTAPLGSATTTLQPAPTVRCPIVALELVSETPHGEVVMAKLSEDGTVSGPPELSSRPLGQMDERGCVIGEGGSVIDWTLGDELWLDRATLPADERRVGRFVIDQGGRVTSEETPEIVMRLEGFQPEALCAGKLLVGVMHAMMAGVSMAVVEGVAESLDPPADSACPDRHRKAK